MNQYYGPEVVHGFQRNLSGGRDSFSINKTDTLGDKCIDIALFNVILIQLPCFGRRKKRKGKESVSFMS